LAYSGLIHQRIERLSRRPVEDQYRKVP